MRTHKLLLFFCFLTIFTLYAPIKNLTGSSYARVQHNKASVYKERTPWVNLYKSMLTEHRTDLISLDFQYVIPSDLLTLNIGTGSTLTQSNGMATLSAGTETTITSTITTKKSVNSSPGHEVFSSFTAMFPTPTASGGSHSRYIGMLTANDGIAIGFQNTTFGILYMQNGTVIFIPQSNFNIDVLDGTGPSSFILDTTKLNIYSISFGSIGATPLEFGIINENGHWIPFHRIRYPNLYTIPTVFNSSLPLAMAVSKNNSGTGSLDIFTTSWNASIAGKEHETRIFTAGIHAKTITGNTFVPILSIKNRTTYAHKTNTAHMRLVHANFSGYTAGNQLRIRLYKEPTLSNSSFSDVDASLSIAQKDTAATSFSSTGTLLFQTSVYSQGDTNIFFKENGINIELYPGETLSVAGAEGGSGSVAMDTSFTWQELQ